jgi:hypothetical protein
MVSSMAFLVLQLNRFKVLKKKALSALSKALVRGLVV